MPKTAVRAEKTASPTVTFMKGVLKANKVTGALGPSSRALAEVVTDMARLENAGVIVEYGPGTGVFTEAIIKKMRPDAYLLALEVQPEFVRATAERCPRAHVVQDGAQFAQKYLREAGYDGCERIVSGLPWTRFPEELQDEILQATYDVLVPGGVFLTFAYAMSPLVPSGRRFFKEKLRHRFPNVRKSKIIWENFPPCNVYVCTKPK